MSELDQTLTADQTSLPLRYLPTYGYTLVSQLQAQVDIKIPFEDVDMFEIARHGHYAKYFEVARCALLEKINYTYSNMRNAGLMYPVVDMQIKYIKPVAFGQSITVKATLVSWENMFKLEYDIRDVVSDAPIAKGSTKQAAVVIDTMQLLRVCPDELAEKIKLAIQSVDRPGE